MIENERNPSLGPLVTLLLAVEDVFYGFSTLWGGPTGPPLWKPQNRGITLVERQSYIKGIVASDSPNKSWNRLPLSVKGECRLCADGS